MRQETKWTTELAASLEHARSGNELAREKLIQHYRPYILNSTGKMCKRYVTWSDEEASIALLAFNRAIDTFDVHKGRSFLNYSYLLMKRDLIDFFKKESKVQLAMPLEVDQSLAVYTQTQDQNELVDEILSYDNILEQFGVNI